jgi:hypothetical protein
MPAVAAVSERRASGGDSAALPPPLVKPLRHPLRWTRQRLALLGVRALFTYVGICAVAAAYYLLLETHVGLPWSRETNTQAWHRLIPEAKLRHNIRDVGEGLFGGLLAISLAYNHYRRIGRKHRVDRIEIALRIPNVKSGRKLAWWQILLGIVLIPAYAAPGFFVGEWLVSVIHPAVNHLAEVETGSLLTNVKNNLIENWPKKLIGFAAAFFFGHRPALAIIDDVQLWLAERRVALSRSVRFYQTPPFKARYNEVAASGTVQPRASKGVALRVSVAALALAVIGLAGYGYYVLNYIAK